MAFRAYFDEMILTKSQTNLEFGSFSSKPRSLRLTHKSDRGQKSTYFLQIPLLLAILYYSVVILYNWMVASVLFSKVLNITYLGDPNTMLDPIYTIGSPEVVTSATGFVAAMSILLPYIVVFVLPFVMQIKIHQRTLALRPLCDENMPYPGCDSMVVSAACHTRPDESDISDQRIQWGVVEQARGTGEDAAGRCGFCVRRVHVNQPREGFFYTGISGIRESP